MKKNDLCYPSSFSLRYKLFSWCFLGGMIIAAMGLIIPASAWANEKEIQELKKKIEILKLEKELENLKQEKVNRRIAGSKDEANQDQGIYSNPQTVSLGEGSFTVGVLFIPSPNLKFGKGKVTGTISSAGGNREVNEDIDPETSKFDSALGVRIAAFYPLANRSWVSLGGDLYGESSPKEENSVINISPKFIFANLGFGETISFFFGGGLGDIGYKLDDIRGEVSVEAQSVLAPFFQIGVNYRYSRFAFELFYRSIKNDIKGTVKIERLKFKLRSEVKTNMTSLAITALF